MLMNKKEQSSNRRPVVSEFDAVSSNGGIGTQTRSDNDYSAFSDDVTAAILVFQNNETERQILWELDSFLM